MKKKSVLLLITLLCIVITVILWFAVNKSNPEYTEVSAKVLTSETKTKKVAKSRTTYYEVTVQYKGDTYDLKNVHSGAAYSVGREVNVYLSNGKMYSDIAGVKTSTPLSIVYFVFLFGSFGMVILSASFARK